MSKLPEGCVCPPHEWFLTTAPDACAEFVDGGSDGCCESCEHLRGCHAVARLSATAAARAEALEEAARACDARDRWHLKTAFESFHGDILSNELTRSAEADACAASIRALKTEH